MNIERQVRADFEKFAFRLGECSQGVPSIPISPVPPSYQGAYIDISTGGNLSYQHTERGQIEILNDAADVDDLLYFVFSDICFSLAVKNVALPNIEGEDDRKYWFRRAVELLTKIEPEYGKRARAEYQEILKTSPLYEV